MKPQTASVFGRGAPQLDLTAGEMRAIVASALRDLAPESRVLAIVPDKTRDDNTDVLFPILAEILSALRVKRFDALIAQGTHGPMTEQEKRAKLGAGLGLPGLNEIYDHRWDDAAHLVTIGQLSAEQVAEATQGLIAEAVALSVNKLLAPGNYDIVLVIGATVPHEVAGFAGGAKYFFPGVAGPELTNLTHWLGALATIERVIGRIETPTRRLIELAATHIPARVIAFNSVVTRETSRLRTHALFAGELSAAFRQSAAISRQLHIKYTGRRYRRVVALLDEHYDEMWVGGKASYKLGGVIEEGGELIIYAPHLKRLSATHGRLIERYGYAPLEEVKEMVARSEELRANLCVAAHLAHVVYASRRDENGRLVPRYRITLASAIDRETCARVRLGWMDPRSFRLEDYAGDPNTLIVERAGRDLYLVAPDD